MKARSFILVTLLATLMGAMIFSQLQAQEATTATPAPTAAATNPPLFFIPTVTPLPTATLSPGQITGALESYGLQDGDLPGFLPAAHNSVVEIDRLQEQLAALYPDQAVVIRSLATLYESYGIVGSSIANFFAADCQGQAIFGVGSWVRGAVSQASANALIEDPTLPGLYQGIFNWNPIELDGLPGRAYTAPIPAAICPSPSTQYVVEYTHERLVIAISVFAPTTTDLSLVQSTLDVVIRALNQRLNATEPANGGASVTPTPAPTEEVEIGLIPFGSPANPTVLNPDLRWIGDDDSNADSYDLAMSPDALTMIVGPNSTVEVCYTQTGDFEAQVKLTQDPARDHGAVLALDAGSSSRAEIRIGKYQDYDNQVVYSRGETDRNSTISQISTNYPEATIYLKAIRRGSFVTLAYSRNGSEWLNSRENFIMSLPQTMDICLRTFSVSSSIGTIAQFEDFKVIPA